MGSRLEILLWRSDGEWRRGQKVRSRARESRRGSSPCETRPENLAGEVSPPRFFRTVSEGRAPQRIRGDIQQSPAVRAQRGDVPCEIFRAGLGGTASPCEIFWPGGARNPFGSAPGRPGVAAIRLGVDPAGSQRSTILRSQSSKTVRRSSASSGEIFLRILNSTALPSSSGKTTGSTSAEILAG